MSQLQLRLCSLRRRGSAEQKDARPPVGSPGGATKARNRRPNRNGRKGLARERAGVLGSIDSADTRAEEASATGGSRYCFGGLGDGFRSGAEFDRGASSFDREQPADAGQPTAKGCQQEGQVGFG